MQFSGMKQLIQSVLKLKFHWDQFPRNFPVANVMGKSPTSYEEAGDFQTISTCQDGLACRYNFLVTSH